MVLDVYGVETFFLLWRCPLPLVHIKGTIQPTDHDRGLEDGLIDLNGGRQCEMRGDVLEDSALFSGPFSEQARKRTVCGAMDTLERHRR